MPTETRCLPPSPKRSSRYRPLARLPVVSGRELVRVLERSGYVMDRQKGSHMILRHTQPPFRRVTVPDHKELAKGTLRAILRSTGLTVDELITLL